MSKYYNIAQYLAKDPQFVQVWHPGQAAYLLPGLPTCSQVYHAKSKRKKTRETEKMREER